MEEPRLLSWRRLSLVRKAQIFGVVSGVLLPLASQLLLFVPGPFWLVSLAVVKLLNLPSTVVHESLMPKAWHFTHPALESCLMILVNASAYLLVCTILA